MPAMTLLLRSLLAVLALLLLCALWQLGAAQGQLTGVQIQPAQMRELSQPERPWQKLDRRLLTQWAGPYELRFEIDLDEQAARQPLVLGLLLRAASELSWDGQALAGNGRVGLNQAEEQPGRVDHWVPLPPQTAGRHQLQVRASSHWPLALRSAEAELRIASLQNQASARYAPWLVAAAAFGCLALAWGYFLLAAHHASQQATQQTGRRSEQRLLLALGLVGLLLPLAEAWRPLLGYAYPWHPWRLGLILGLTGLAAWLLPLALAARWQLLGPARRWVPLAGLSFLLLAWAGPGYSYDMAGYFAHVLGLLAAALMCWRGRAQEPGMAWPLLATVLCSLALALIWPGAFLDGFYFLALTLLMSLLLLGHARGLLRLGEQAARSEAQRAELQTRLLRNSMQPHWLMNTLTSLQELIETEPARASRMVDLLAEEFSQLRQLGDAPLITLEQELELCRAHLRILALLRGHDIALEVEGQATGIMLPPGLLHTLVENALTHGGELHGQPAFLLQIEPQGDATELRFRAPQGPGRKSNKPSGAGRHFIETSLATAFPGRWQFSDGPDGQGHWCSLLVLPQNAGGRP